MTQTEFSYNKKNMIIFIQASRQGTKTVIQLHLCLNNPPRDRYPACHLSVLSCNQRIIVLNTIHDVSNIYNHKDINTVVLPLVATTHPRPRTFLSLERRHKRGHEPTI